MTDVTQTLDGSVAAEVEANPAVPEQVSTPDLPDESTSVPPQQDESMLVDMVEGVGTGLTRFGKEATDFLDGVTFGVSDKVSRFMNEHVADLGHLGTDAEGKVFYARGVEQALRKAEEAGIAEDTPEHTKFVLDNVQETYLTDGLQTFAGNMTAGVTQFLAGLAITRKVSGKVFQPTTKAGKNVKLAGDAMAAELLAFDKYDARLSNFIQEFPALENPVTEYLSADRNDPVAEAIFKQALETAGLEAMAVPFVLAVKASKANKANFEETEQIVEELGKALDDLEERDVIDYIAQTDEEIAAFVRSDDTLKQAYEEASALTGAERTAARGEGRASAMAEKTTTQIKEMEAQGAGTVVKQQDSLAEGGDWVVKWASNHETDEDAILQFVKLNRQTNPKFQKFAERSIVMAKFADNNFTAVVEKFKGGQATREEAVKAFKAVMEITHMTQGAISTSGRVLNLSKVIDGWGMNTLNVALETGAAFANSGQRSRFMNLMGRYAYQVGKAGNKGVDILNELFINSILSGVKTHVVNIGSNTFNMGVLPLEKFAGAVLTGNKKEALKALQLYQGYGIASWDSVKGSVSALRNGRPLLDFNSSTLEEGLQQQAIPNFLGGKYIGLPTRLLAAEDEFFKQMNFRAFAFAEASADARAKGLKGAEANRYVKQQVNKAIDEQLQASINGKANSATDPITTGSRDFARRATFTTELEKGSITRSIQDIADRHPLLRQIMPFIRTPANIFSEVTQRSPLAFLSKRWREDAFSGNKQRMAEAGLRLTTGMGLMVYFYNMALDDKITGSGAGLTRDQVKGLEDITGYETNAIVDEAGNYSKVSRLSPVTDLQTIMASIRDLNRYGMYDEADEIAQGTVLVLTEYARDKSWLRGLDEFISVVEDPARNAESYGANKLAALVPYSGLLRSLNEDPYMRKISEMSQGYLKSIPSKVNIMGFEFDNPKASTFSSEALDPNRNFIGEPIDVPEFWGKSLNLEFASPMGFSEKKTDPLAVAWMEAAKSGTPFSVGLPPKTKNGIDLTSSKFTLDSEGNPMNPNRPKQTAYDMWQYITSTIKINTATNDTGIANAKPLTLRESLTELVQTEGYKKDKTLDLRVGDFVFSGTKEEIIQDVVKAYRDQAWTKLIGEDPYALEDRSHIDGYRLLYVPDAVNQRLAKAYWTHSLLKEATKNPLARQTVQDNSNEFLKDLTGDIE